MRNRRLYPTSFALLAVLASFSGCAAPSGDFDEFTPILPGEEEVIDGAETTAEWLRGVVKIMNSDGTYCSGGLIDPRVVITAAHCHGPKTVRVYTSRTAYKSYSVKSYKFHHNWEWHFAFWSGTNRHDDIQAVYLNSAVPASVAKPLAYENDAPPKLGGAVIVGFGRYNADNGDGGGIKRIGFVNVVHNKGSIEVEPGVLGQYGHKGDSGTVYLQWVEDESPGWKVVALHSGRDDGVNGKGPTLYDQKLWLFLAIVDLAKGGSSGSF
ncbi:MAG: trypsin-like serine protease [Polyangiales bacterium]